MLCATLTVAGFCFRGSITAAGAGESDHVWHSPLRGDVHIAVTSINVRWVGLDASLRRNPAGACSGLGFFI